MLLDGLSGGRGDDLTSLSLVPASVTVRRSEKSRFPTSPVVLWFVWSHFKYMFN